MPIQSTLSEHPKLSKEKKTVVLFCFFLIKFKYHISSIEHSNTL